MEYKDYYKTLGVSKTATQAEIKKAFRKLAREYHPDVNKAPDAEAKFKEINEANEVLSDPDKRQKYDQFGSQWQQYSQQGGQPGGFDWSQWRAQNGQQTQYRTATPEDFSQAFGGSGFSDFFETLFGGRGGFSQAGRSQSIAQAGRDLEHEVEVTLEEAFSGTTRNLTWESGRSLQAKIPKGVRTGSKVRLSGQGESGYGNAPAGDLYLNIKVLDHPRFERDGDDLRFNLPVDLYTLVLGGEVSVRGIDRTVKLNIPASTQNGKAFRLRGLGMPKLRQPDERGDLYAVVTVKLPENLTPQETALFEQLRQLRSDTP